LITFIALYRRIAMTTENTKIAFIGAAALIIGAAIGAAGGIFAAIIIAGGNKNAASVVYRGNVSISVLGSDTGAPIPGAVITVTGSGKKVITQDYSMETGEQELGVMEIDDYKVQARADNYEAAERVFNLHIVPWEMWLKYMLPPIPLPFAGWEHWGNGLSAIPCYNTVTLNGAFNTAGYTAANIKPLGGKRLVLEITGTKNSRFYNNQLLKLETADNAALKPLGGLKLIEDGYIPVIDGRVIFAIPDDFTGRLNLVFYRAELNDLRIAAFVE
jgi:hypothetical protein